jgi:hypothetical protein
MKDRDFDRSEHCVVIGLLTYSYLLRDLDLHFSRSGRVADIPVFRSEVRSGITANIPVVTACTTSRNAVAEQSQKSVFVCFIIQTRLLALTGYSL